MIDDMINNNDVIARTLDLYSKVKEIVKIIEKKIVNTYSAEGLYAVIKKGIMPVPYLWECREEFKEAISWRTGLINGGIKVIDEIGNEINPIERIKNILW